MKPRRAPSAEANGASRTAEYGAQECKRAMMTCEAPSSNVARDEASTIAAPPGCDPPGRPSSSHCGQRRWRPRLGRWWSAPRRRRARDRPFAWCRCARRATWPRAAARRASAVGTQFVATSTVGGSTAGGALLSTAALHAVAFAAVASTHATANSPATVSVRNGLRLVGHRNANVARVVPIPVSDFPRRRH